MRKLICIFVVSVSILLFQCSPTEPDIGSPPDTPTFITAATDNPNYVVFTVTSTDCFLYNWDFGNGTTSKKKSDTAYYPFPDIYTVTLTISNKGGASTVVKDQIITTLDSSIAKNVKYRLLTGGIDALNGKTWMWLEKDSSLIEGEYSDGYSDPVGNFWWSWKLSDLNPLALDDEYVFTLKNYKYENNCKGFFEYDWLWANKLLGMDQGEWKDSAFAYDPEPSTWSLTEQLNITIIDTVIFDTNTTFDSSVIIDTVIIDTLFLDTIHIDTSIIIDTLIIDTILIDTFIIDTVISDTIITIDTVVIDTIIIDTMIFDTIYVDTSIIDTNVIIDTIIIDTTVTIDTTIINTTVADTTLILEFANNNYIGRCAGTSTYQILQLVEDTMWVRYALYDPVEKKIDAWYYMRFLAKK